MDIKFESILMTDTMPNLVKKVNSAQDTLKENILNILNGLDINIGTTSSSDSGSSGISSQNSIGTNTPIDKIQTRNVTLYSYGEGSNILDIKDASKSSDTKTASNCGFIRVESDGKSLLSVNKINVGELTADKISSNDSALDVNGISIGTRLNYNIQEPTISEDNSLVVDKDTSSYTYIKNTEDESFSLYFTSPEGSSDLFNNGDVFNFMFDQNGVVSILVKTGSETGIEIINMESNTFEVTRGQTLQLVLISQNKSSSGSSSDVPKYVFAAYLK